MPQKTQSLAICINPFSGFVTGRKFQNRRYSRPALYSTTERCSCTCVWHAWHVLHGLHGLCLTCVWHVCLDWIRLVFCCGSLVSKRHICGKVSMDILLLPPALPKLHTCPGCAYTPLSCTSEGRAAVSPILEFSACYEARESVDVDGQALCLLRCQDIRGNNGLRGCSPSTEKGV